MSAKMTHEELFQKLNKLKEFAERDCGNETENAKRIIARLCKEYNVSFPYENWQDKQRVTFPYENWQDKQRREAALKAAEQRQREANAQREREMITESVTISHISSKDITVALCRRMRIPYCVKGWKVYVKCTPSMKYEFDKELYRIKMAWKRGMDAVNQQIIDDMNTIKW